MQNISPYFLLTNILIFTHFFIDFLQKYLSFHFSDWNIENLLKIQNILLTPPPTSSHSIYYFFVSYDCQISVQIVFFGFSGYLCQSKTATNFIIFSKILKFPSKSCFHTYNNYRIKNKFLNVSKTGWKNSIMKNLNSALLFFFLCLS